MSRLLPGLLPELAMPETAYNCQHQKINLKKVEGWKEREALLLNPPGHLEYHNATRQTIRFGTIKRNSWEDAVDIGYIMSKTPFVPTCPVHYFVYCTPDAADKNRRVSIVKQTGTADMTIEGFTITIAPRYQGMCKRVLQQQLVNDYVEGMGAPMSAGVKIADGRLDEQGREFVEEVVTGELVAKSDFSAYFRKTDQECCGAAAAGSGA